MSPQTVTGHFCAIVSRHVMQRSYQTYHWLDVRLILQDFTGLSRNRSVRTSHGAMLQSPMVAYLLAQPLHVALGQLLAAHEALDPAVQGGDGRRLRRGGRRQLHGLGHLDVLHVGIHGWRL
jgi:hypothetical protein